MRFLWMLPAFLCFLLIGCQGQNAIVGRWKLQPSAEVQATPQGAPTISLEFKPDNTFSMVIVWGTKSDTITGKYKLEGKTLTLTPETEGGKPAQYPPEVITMADDMKSFPAPNAPEVGAMVRE